MIRDEDFSSQLNNSATFLGFTALHYAVLINDLDMIKLLLKYGANPCIQNDSGNRPVEYAADENVKKLLDEHTLKVHIKKVHKLYIVFLNL